MFLKLAKRIVQIPLAVQTYMTLRYIFSMTDDFARKMLGKKPVLYLLEYHIADHCNMNCKGCYHFSCLVKSESFPQLQHYRRDIQRLAALFANIKTIHLMGGEPLLNNELPGFIRETRAAFPAAKICILTNGILYKKIEGELLEAIKLCDVLVQVSLYKPMIPRKDEMRAYFLNQGIKHWIGEPVLYFAKYINPAGDSDPVKTSRQCPASRCTFLGDGHIARCALPFNIGYFNRHFGLDIPAQQDKTDIHSGDSDGFALKRKLLRPMPLCKYCRRLKWAAWEPAACKPAAGGAHNIEDFCHI
ncbi:MAG: radical SAM protein [Spirochaetes bacterium]|nr:radical SAM protein [Spirochaetota bacterium]